MKKVEIIVLQISDVHGQILPVDYALNEELESGLIRLAHIVKTERKKSNNVLLIDNGDLIQGTPFAYYYAKVEALKKNPIILTANSMKYDCAVAGNHEFNYGLKLLERTVAQSNFPWLSANILNEETGESYFGKPYIIKTMEGGVRVAILGLTTSYIPNWESPKHIEGLQFISATEAAKKWVPILQGMADLVIVSYHGGFERSLDTGEPAEMLTGENEGYQICEEVPGIDLLLSGHQHRELSGETINGVPILQPGSKGSNIGKAVISLQKNQSGRWEITKKQTELIRATSLGIESELLHQLQPYEVTVQEWLDKPIGRVLGDMTIHDPMAIRLKDSPLIQFINEVQMEAAGTKISNTALFSDDAPGFPQQVTMRDVMANYIYPNTLKVLRISGRDILDALEQSATYFEQYDGKKVHVNKAFCEPKPQHYNYDMWAGIEYELDISRPAGQRVVKLKYENQDLELDGLFDVVMNNYRAGGGGNYFMYAGKPVVREIQIDVSELIADYFMKHGTVTVMPTNGWRVVY